MAPYWHMHLNAWTLVGETVREGLEDLVGGVTGGGFGGSKSLSYSQLVLSASFL